MQISARIPSHCNSIAGFIVVRLQVLITKGVSSHGRSASNTVPDMVRLLLSIRSYMPEVCDRLMTSVKADMSNFGFSIGCLATLSDTGSSAPGEEELESFPSSSIQDAATRLASSEGSRTLLIRYTENQDDRRPNYPARLEEERDGRLAVLDPAADFQPSARSIEPCNRDPQLY